MNVEVGQSMEEVVSSPRSYPYTLRLIKSMRGKSLDECRENLKGSDREAKILALTYLAESAMHRYFKPQDQDDIFQECMVVIIKKLDSFESSEFPKMLSYLKKATRFRSPGRTYEKKVQVNTYASFDEPIIEEGKALTMHDLISDPCEELPGDNTDERELVATLRAAMDKLFLPEDVQMLVEKYELQGCTGKSSIDRAKELGIGLDAISRRTILCDNILKAYLTKDINSEFTPDKAPKHRLWTDEKGRFCLKCGRYLTWDRYRDGDSANGKDKNCNDCVRSLEVGDGKVCTKCGTFKLSSEFHKSGKSKAGAIPRCKLCTNHLNKLKMRERRKENSR